MFSGWKKIFGSKMKAEDWGVDMVQIWFIALNDLGMTQAEFQQAKRKTLGLSWQPTAPADFFALADSVNNYADVDMAFRSACNECGKMPECRKWADSVIYETARRCGIDVLANCTHGYINQFKRVYEGVISEHRQGAVFEVPKPVKAIEIKPANSDVADDYLSKMMAMLGKKVA